MPRGERLDQPREPRRIGMRRPRYDPDTFGRFSESIARSFGTARFLITQTIIVIIWIIYNGWAAINVLNGRPFDKYPFILLNLAFSVQAAYAAPFILLAQTRQADRDRIQSEEDRARDLRNVADTEYLIREVAALRIALGEVATRDFVRSELQRLLDEREPPTQNP